MARLYKRKIEQSWMIHVRYKAERASENGGHWDGKRQRIGEPLLSALAYICCWVPRHAAVVMVLAYTTAAAAIVTVVRSCGTLNRYYCCKVARSSRRQLLTFSKPQVLWRRDYTRPTRSRTWGTSLTSAPRRGLHQKRRPHWVPDTQREALDCCVI